MKLDSKQSYGLAEVIADTPGIFGMSTDSYTDIHPDVMAQWLGETYPVERAQDGRRINPHNRPTQEPTCDNYGRPLPTVRECREAMRACALYGGAL